MPEAVYRMADPFRLGVRPCCIVSPVMISGRAGKWILIGDRNLIDIPGGRVVACLNDLT